MLLNKMDKSQILTYLQEVMPGEYGENVPMSKHTSFRIGGPADILVMPSSAAQLQAVVKMVRASALPLTIIGNGSNLLVRDKGIRGVVIKLGTALKEVTVEGEKVKAGAGTLLGALAGQTANLGLSGLEFAAGIPGSLGGAVVMNAGAYDGEIKKVLEAVTVLLPTGEFARLTSAELDLNYRHSIFQTAPYKEYIITGVELALHSKPVAEIKAVIEDYTQRRISKQPLELPSGGSMFKRPPGYFAAALIDEAGLRGFTVGGAQVSTKHTGFVVNVGNATAKDVLSLIKEVQAKIFALKGIKLEPEVRIMGEE